MMEARRPILILAAAALILGGVGCSDDDDPATPPTTGSHDLTFTGTLGPHANQMLRVLVIRDSDGAIAANETVTLPGDGTFSFDWANILADGDSYRIDFYADFNGDGECDSPPVDHSWRIGLGTVNGDVTRDFQHDTNFTDVCDSFEFRLRFTASLAPHAGQTLWVAIVKDSSGGETIQIDQVTVPADGAVAFSWDRILDDGEDYFIDFYADHNGNGQCDAPPADHAWRIAIDDVRGPLDRDFQHDTNFTEVCGSFVTR
jgi:hypothetical protein